MEFGALGGAFTAEECVEGIPLIKTICFCDEPEVEPAPTADDDACTVPENPDGCYFCSCPDILFSNPDTIVSFPGVGDFPCSYVMEIGAQGGVFTAEDCDA